LSLVHSEMASVSDDDVAMKPPEASEPTSSTTPTVPDETDNKDDTVFAPRTTASSSDPNNKGNDNDNNKGNDNDNDNANETNNGESSSSPKTNNMSNTVISLGGKRLQKSFALLDGVFQDPESDEKERVTIDITRLPALLGRSNESDKDNPNFFGLGKKKALSRKHCTIYYRDREGGHAEWDDTEKNTIYKDAAETMQPSTKKAPPKPNPHLVRDDNNDDNNDDDDEEEEADDHNKEKEGGGLPPTGFFVIECLGKNRILVDRTRVEQGESMVLRSGSAIRISSYMFYFLIPTDAEPKPHMIELPLSDEEKEKAASISTKMGGKKKPPSATLATKKRSSSISSNSSSKNSSKDNNTVDIKKVASSAAAASASKKRPVRMIAPSAIKKPKMAGTNSATATLAELEVLPVEELIEKMDEAVSKGLWDRKNQFIGATVCYHAVRSAGASIPIQEKVATGGGVSRSDIMEWIEQSDMYGGWVQQMLTNMEPRSYQAAVTKSLLKSGFIRTSGAGRYIKWLIPADIPMKVKAKKKKAKPKDDEGKTTKPNPKLNPIDSATKEEKDEGGNETGDDNDSDDDGSDQQPGENPMNEDDADEEDEEEEEEASANDDSREDENEAGENDNESDTNEEEDGNDEEIEDDDDDDNDTNNNNNNTEEKNEQSDDHVAENERDGEMDIIF
jgi:hypothetical protein